jgi:nuclear protein localization family protein 4
MVSISLQKLILCMKPYDSTYLKENNIKHMSYAAYLKKSRISASSTAMRSMTGRRGLGDQPLEMPDYRVNVNCTNGHAPWPRSICSKCQPSAVTLKRQEFRMVDYVEFASQHIVNDFLDAWRSTGKQRFGWLYGHYERYDAVPLGIKAVVEAIYEPKQICDQFWFEVEGVADPNYAGDAKAEQVARGCGLQRIGMIWTDLLDDGSGTGKVICKRHIKSFFLSAQECQFAAAMQLRHMHTTPYSSTGKFGSRFVSCVISGG